MFFENDLFSPPTRHPRPGGSHQSKPIASPGSLVFFHSRTTGIFNINPLAHAIRACDWPQRENGCRGPSVCFRGNRRGLACVLKGQLGAVRYAGRASRPFFVDLRYWVIPGLARELGPDLGCGRGPLFRLRPGAVRGDQGPAPYDDPTTEIAK